MTAILASFIGQRAAGIVGGVLGFIIPAPLILIFAALAWVHFDKSSAVRAAVDKAVTDLVAGAEINALKATISAQREIAARSADVAAEALRRARAGREALETLNARLAGSQAENKEIKNDLEDLLSRPVSGDCLVDPSVLERLRGR